MWTCRRLYMIPVWAVNCSPWKHLFIRRDWRCDAVSVWFEGWGRVTVFSWGRRRRSAIPNLLMLTITALAWRAHATRVKRVMENKDHLTHHSRASEWVAGRRGGSHWTAMLWKDCSLLFAMKQVFVSPRLTLSVWHLWGLKSQKNLR